MEIPLYKHIDLEHIQHTDPVLRSGRHVSPATYQDGGEVLFDTPALEVKNGFCVSENRCYLELVLKRRDTRFYNFLVDMGDNGTTITHNKSRDWFGKQMPYDVVDDYHRSVVKLGGSKGVATIKCKVPYNKKRDRIGVKVYDSEGGQLKHGELKDGMFVVARLRYNGLRFLKQMFTEEYELVRLTVQNDVTEESLENRYSNGYDFGFDENYDQVTVNEDLLNEYSEEDQQGGGEQVINETEGVEDQQSVEVVEDQTVGHETEEVVEDQDREEVVEDQTVDHETEEVVEDQDREEVVEDQDREEDDREEEQLSEEVVEEMKRAAKALRREERRRKREERRRRKKEDGGKVRRKLILSGGRVRDL